jgi:TolA-binding protein
MASPSNASEPDSPDEEEFIDTGFDALLFWDRYRQFILIAAGVLILALAGFGIYEYQQSQLLAASGALLAQATTEDDYRALIDKYPGTVAAGNASLMLAGKLRADNKFDDAMQVLQTFLDKYPTHPLAHAGDLSIAETLEAQGKIDDAVTRYQEVAAKYPDSYSAPISILDQANILQAQGKTEEARRTFENFLAQFPDSVFAQQATAELHLLRSTPGAASAPASSAETRPPGITDSFLNSVRAQMASPSPAASPPAIPVIPGSTH